MATESDQRNYWASFYQGTGAQICPENLNVYNFLTSEDIMTKQKAHAVTVADCFNFPLPMHVQNIVVIST